MPGQEKLVPALNRGHVSTAAFAAVAIGQENHDGAKAEAASTEARARGRTPAGRLIHSTRARQGAPKRRHRSNLSSSSAELEASSKATSRMRRYRR
jgi:hypothetical protein